MIKLANLATFPAGTMFEADLAIVGAGPVGLTIAREFFGTSVSVLVLESGLAEQSPDYAALNALDSVGEPNSDAQRRMRADFHGDSLAIWSEQQQPYGVRCRALGGSTHAWAGKSAPFDPVDFAARPWIPHSGWPVGHAAMQPFLRRAMEVLNLGAKQPDVRFETEGLRSFYWQFARSRINHLDIMRFGREVTTWDAENVQILLNATVTRIALAADGNAVDHLQIATLDATPSRVKARAVVIAASGIENPRLLLASNTVNKNGIGNGNDVVGRYLMDHLGAQVAHFPVDAIGRISRRFGFLGVKDAGRTSMYMHGLALHPSVQEREGLGNCALYFMTHRSLDDPWDALKRLMRRSSRKPLRDIRSVVSGAGLVARGAGMQVLGSDRTPEALKKFVVNAAIRYNPNLAAEEFQSAGLPHKLTGLSMDAIAEQRPNAASRVMLSDRTDRFGVPLAKVDWRIDDADRRALARIGQLAATALARAGLPAPTLEPWVADNRLGDGVVIDMAHILGTTRMSDDPKRGVVDRDCRVHGVRGLYIAGGSVFPTSGHANPTLMILAFAVRLADTLKTQFLDRRIGRVAEFAGARGTVAPAAMAASQP